MKGIVFNELMELVEDKFGLEVADEIIESSSLDSGGSYTATGTYDYNEILTLVGALSEKTGASPRDLVMAFGGHLAATFSKKYPDFFKDKDLFSFLKSVDQFIHVEVKKLYPAAELPKFTHEEPNTDTLIMHYSSKRPFADLAEGLIRACADHFETPVEIKTSEPENSGGTERTFNIKKAA